VRLLPALLLLAAACSHSEPFGTAPTTSDGPFSTAAPVRLTYNSFTDSAASLTSDGNGILYLYTGRSNGDRCIGLLPPGGGTQRWSHCDERAGAADSSKSFSAPALAEDGRLLYLQALALRGRINPDRTTLWLADSANPLVRRALLTFPTNLGGRGVSWLTDAEWTGANAFIARAGLLNLAQACSACPYDTTVVSTGLVRGTIAAGGATLSFVPGADDLSFHALAEGAASIVFLRDAATIFRVPTTGGTPVAIGTLPTGGTTTGIACRLSECLVTQTGPRPSPATGLETRMYRIRLATNTIDLVRTELGRWAGPVILPSGGDVAMQSSTGPTRDLYLFKGLIP
jgi:hypothetical protein